MRLLFVIILLLSLPVLVIAHRQHYSMSLHGPLLVQAGVALDAPEFAQVETSLQYMDATLKGVVADLETRDRARKLVDDLPGLRCREQDNLLQVDARLSGKLDGTTLTISGWLHDEVILESVINWIAEARPGLEIDAENVRVSPHVTAEEPPKPDMVPGAFRSVWSAIEVPASLVLVREGAKLSLSGYLPELATKEAVIDSVKGSSNTAELDATRLESGVYVKDAMFAEAGALSAFLRSFFHAPGASRFEANERNMLVMAHATPSMQQEWTTLLEPLTKGAKLGSSIQVFPSVFHFPGRKLETQITEGAMTILNDALRAAPIDFGPGYATSDAAQEPKLAALAAAIIAAGPDARIVAGGHVDVTGNLKDNEKMARRRAENVVASLVARGVPAQVMEAAVFEAVPGDSGRVRQVELIIK